MRPTNSEAETNPRGEIGSATKPIATSEALTQEMLMMVEAGEIIHAGHVVNAFMRMHPDCDHSENELRAMALRIAVSKAWPIEYGD